MGKTQVDPENELEALAKKAEGGNREAEKQLQEYFTQHNGSLLRYNDMAHHAERELINQIMKASSPLARMIFEERQAQLRKELTGENPSPLEALLVRRVSLCWLQAYYSDTLFVNSLSTNGIGGTEDSQRYQDRAHKRLLSAVKALVQIRKLDVRVQVNIAEKQMNVS